MKAIILAAGRGSRMKALTEARPKCLIEVRGRALLDRQIDALRGAGINEISIVTGYRRELLAKRGLFEFRNLRWSETNMVSSLECASLWLEAEPCVVSYSDIFYESSAVTSLMKSDAALAVTYDPRWLELWQKRFGDPLLDAETFKLRTDSTLAEIGNTPRSVDEIQGQYMGLLRFTPHGWSEVMRIRAALSQAERDRMHMTGTLQKVIDEERIAIEAIEYRDSWGEVDNADDLRLFNER